MDKELIEIGTRIANSLEKLAEEPSFIEMAPSPPTCPHCSAIDPQLTIEGDGGGIGPASEFVLEAYCNSCKKPIYGVVNHWVFHSSVDEARDNIKYIHERQGQVNAVRS